jgi:hypothetical protein
MLHDTEIDSLVTKGFLKSKRRRDHAAIQSAIDDFICRALGPEQDQTISSSSPSQRLEVGAFRLLSRALGATRRRYSS